MTPIKNVLVVDGKTKLSSRVYELILAHKGDYTVKKTCFEELEGTSADIIIFESIANIDEYIKNPYSKIKSSTNITVLLLANTFSELDVNQNAFESYNNTFVASDPCFTWDSSHNFTVACKVSGEGDDEIKKAAENILSIIYAKVYWVPNYKDILAADKLCQISSLVASLSKTCLENSARKTGLSGPIDINKLTSQGLISASAIMREKNISCSELEASVATPGGITATFNSVIDSNKLAQEIKTILTSFNPLNRTLR